MIELSRAVRFCVHRGGQGSRQERAVVHNGFAGWPAMRGLGAFYELVVTCRGKPDPVTGFLINIKAIDEAVRRSAIPVIEAAFQDDAATEGAGGDAELRKTFALVVEAVTRELKFAQRITWRLTPYYCLTMTFDRPQRVVVTQQFEFAAAHRLHCEELEEAQNRSIYGKCNSLNGHGHNYRLEVSVVVPTDSDDSAAVFGLARLEEIVDRLVIDRFDHKNLNLDTAEFARVNPSVEHIARVCYGLLVQPLLAAGANLERVTIWETEKTSCTYPAAISPWHGG